MSKQAIIKLTVELKEEGYTWDVIYEILQDGFKDLPSFKTVQTWYYHHIRVPKPVKAFPISSEHREEVEAAFIKQLAIMGFSKSEIMKELKNILP